MTNQYSNQYPLTRICTICEAPLTAARVAQLNRQQKQNEIATCTAIECQRIAEQHGVLTHQLFNARINQYRQQRQSQQAKEAQHNAFIEAVNSREAAENQALLDQVMKAGTANQPEAAEFDSPETVVAIPSAPKTVTPLDDTRRNKYLMHVREAIETAFASPLGEASTGNEINNADQQRRQQLLEQEAKLNDTPALKTTCDHLCTMCQGGCCTVGSDHAFITAATIQRLRQSDNTLTNERIFEYYSQALADNTFHNSCINHTPQGCSLTRDLRSDVCNLFYCDELLTYQKNYFLQAPQQQDLPLPLLAIQRANNHWNRLHPDSDRHIIQAAIIDEEGIAQLDISDLGTKERPDQTETPETKHNQFW